MLKCQVYLKKSDCFGSIEYHSYLGSSKNQNDYVNRSFEGALRFGEIPFESLKISLAKIHCAGCKFE